MGSVKDLIIQLNEFYDKAEEEYQIFAAKLKALAELIGIDPQLALTTFLKASYRDEEKTLGRVIPE